MPIVIDPFSIKKHSKLHPARVAFTLYARAIEKTARSNFDKNQLEIKTIEAADAVSWPKYSVADTAVEPNQMAVLQYCLKRDDLPQGAFVEIGSYRGVTTSSLAKGNPDRQLFAIDPFIGYGGFEEDLATFRANTGNLPNVTHIRATSGAAADAWNNGPVAMVFVDAVHDYVNTMFDATTWASKLVPGGYLAMHDTDNRDFSGTRLAAKKIAKGMRLVAHVPDLVVLQKLG